MDNNLLRRLLLPGLSSTPHVSLIFPFQLIETTKRQSKGICFCLSCRSNRSVFGSRFRDVHLRVERCCPSLPVVSSFVHLLFSTAQQQDKADISTLFAVFLQVLLGAHPHRGRKVCDEIFDPFPQSSRLFGRHQSRFGSPSIHSAIHSFIHSAIHSFILQFTHSSIHSLISNHRRVVASPCDVVV